MKIKLTADTKNRLWWMLISIDYDHSRICIADHELTESNLILYLEDKHDFKNSLDECLKLQISAKEFAKVIKFENLNSYEGIRRDAKSYFIYKCRIEINKPIKWYEEDASRMEQQWTREAVVKLVFDGLINDEVDLYNI